jgi:hypothetical protein
MNEFRSEQTAYADDHPRARALKEAALAEPRVQALLRYLHETLGWQAQTVQACHWHGQVPDANPLDGTALPVQGESVLLHDGLDPAQARAVILYMPDQPDQYTETSALILRVVANITHGQGRQMLMLDEHLTSYMLDSPDRLEAAVASLRRDPSVPASNSVAPTDDAPTMPPAFDPASSIFPPGSPGEAMLRQQPPATARFLNDMLTAFLAPPRLDTTSVETILAQLRSLPPPEPSA